MTSTEAMAQVFVTAFKSLSEDEKDEVLSTLMSDQEIREDIQDILLADSRRKESSRSLDDYLNDKATSV